MPLKSSIAQSGDQKIRRRLNPAIAVVGYLETAVFVDDDVLPIELCTGSQPPHGR